MCGIAGFLDARGGRPQDELRRLAGAMNDALAHRGPDGDGVCVDEDAGLALAHRRLAIIDLTETGRQPMLSADGRWAITYNGELYNHLELRRALEEAGVRFRGSSDTETLLEAVSRWGVEATLARTNGMFALALWDRSERRLFLARDRIGIKPLYWAEFAGALLFASQPDALRMHPAFVGEIDRAAVASFLRFGYIPAPRSIWRGVRKLEPGALLAFAPGEAPRIARWWDASAVAVDAAARPIAGEDEALSELEHLAADSVRGQMISDVPLGAFLSGGIDSSTVAALMVRASPKVRTFSIGFREKAYDESAEARRVAAHLGTEHTELVVGAEDALATIPRLAAVYDEPFADSSQIPTLLLSQLTRQHVTVALSGDGGDEVFAGYNRHRIAAEAATLAAIPAPLRRAAAGALGGVSPAAWDRAGALLPARLRPRQLGDKLHKLAGVLRLDDPASPYGQIVAQWPDPAALVGDAAPDKLPPAPPLADPVARMQALDLATYLPDDILVKVDRASMSCGLEVRVPLLDHRIVELGFRVPRAMKLRDGKGKWLLRRLLERHVPRELFERPKSGFALPLGDWLRGPLRDWAEALLAPEVLRRHAITAAPVEATWRAHLSGAANHQARLWTVLMLTDWLERQRPANAAMRRDRAVA
jgi:asparagine synthase (glutamine-hydrolysing)